MEENILSCFEDQMKEYVEKHKSLNSADVDHEFSPVNAQKASISTKLVIIPFRAMF